MNTQEDLTARIKASEFRGKGNDFAAFIFVALGVSASAATTISVAAGALTPEINATLAALPGIVVMVLKTFKFDQRGKWWWEKYHGLLKIEARLQSDDSNSLEIKQQRAEFLEKHYKKWPGFEWDKPPM